MRGWCADPTVTGSFRSGFRAGESPMLTSEMTLTTVISTVDRPDQ
jgi:hypothetical protein